LIEITRLGLSMGAKQQTFMGLSGLGDLILTCTDNQSRNRRLGLLLAKGLSVEKAREEIGQEIEGLNTVKEVGILAKKNHVEMPISEQVNSVINSECTAKEAVSNLVSRQQNVESY
jgi:glycerol-3-phosphate dehydrogenase (NAD(P)+)